MSRAHEDYIEYQRENAEQQEYEASLDFPLVAALRDYKQADADGVMVLVSRQACDEAAAELEWMRDHIRCLIENDPNDDAADAVTVLDVWRKEALERFGEWPPVTPPA